MKLKKIILLLILIFTVIFITSCFVPSYEQIWVHPELHAVGINSMLGVYCDEENAVLILEEDYYGRVLFIYRAASVFTNDGNSQIALVISQKTDEKYSYFYPDVNYVTYEADRGKISGYNGIPIEALTEYFTTEQIEILKMNNDWNKPLNEEKFFSVEIYDVKPGSIVYDKRQNELRLATVNFYPNELAPNEMELFITNAKGDAIFFARQMWYDEILKNYMKGDAYLIIFDKDGNIYEDGIEKIINLWDYEEQLIAFKNRFNWYE
ncbi:MAG: hypothetical protein PHO33_03115 [Clostridia bacterium]|nr:hypothetical protein [Clostridia bacterium]